MTDEFEEEHFEEKPFLEHLEDLRMTLLKIIVATVAGGLVCLAVSKEIFRVLKYPIRRYATIVSEQTSPAAPTKQPATRNIAEGQQPKTSSERPWPGTHVIVTGPLGGVIMLAREVFIYSREALSLLNRHAGKAGSTHSDSSKKGQARPVPQDKTRSPSRDKGKPRPVVNIMETGPARGFIVVFKTSFLCGLAVSMPLNLFFLAQFVFPALTRKEKKYVTPSFLIGGVLFVIGVLFGYFITLPLGIRIFLEWNRRYGIANEWRMSEYLSLATKLLIANGAVFEMPLILTILVRLGVLSVATLRKKRRHAFVIILFAAALLTPTVDGLTMMIVAMPMILMYEACIWVSWLLMKKKRKREEEEEKRESYWQERKKIKRAAKVEPREEKKESPADQAPEEHPEGYPYDEQSRGEEWPEQREEGRHDLETDYPPPEDEEKPGQDEGN